MARLLGQEKVGHRLQRWWLHTDHNGNDQITVETLEDAEPIIEVVKTMAETNSGDFRFKASIPHTIVDECSKVYGAQWGVKPRQAFKELCQNKTDRAKRVWKMLTEGRDHRKLQAKMWR